MKPNRKSLLFRDINLKGEKLRVLICCVVFGVVTLIVIGRAYELQIKKGGELKRLAEEQYLKEIEIIPKRGTIYDRNMEKLAVSLELKSLYADPLMVKYPREVALAISRALGFDEIALLEKLRSKRRFTWIKRFLSQKDIEKINQIRIKGEKLKTQGVRFTIEGKRFYPKGKLAAQLIGFVGTEGKGLEGLELEYDTLLRGETRSREVLKDAFNHIAFISGYLGELDAKGSSLILTIDSRVQWVVEQELSEGVKATLARKGGMAIVMNPQTGEILSMACEPSFDLNKFRKVRDEKRFFNRTVNQLIEPGSIFKPVTFAAAMLAKKLTPDTLIDCERGSFRVGGPPITDHKQYGLLKAEDVLRVSSNIGSAKVAFMMGWEEFRNYLKDFGFDESTGIKLRSERVGSLREAKKLYPRDLASMAFGHGISMNLLRILTFYAAIAAEGKLMKPYLVKKIYLQDGKIVEFHPSIWKRIMSKAVAKKLTHMLARVVHSGTGVMAQVEGYKVAGKTGTAYKIDPITKKYSKDELLVSFIGFLPSTHPRVVIAVVLDEPKKFATGGRGAAPVFSKIAAAVMRILRVAPTKGIGISKKEAVEDVPAYEDDTHLLKNFKLPPKVWLAADSLPDFKEMPMRKALKTAAQLGVDVEVEGSGRVIAQEPPAESSISKLKKLKLIFASSRDRK